MQLLGVFGHPISHSMSPAMHNAALKAVGLEQQYVYLPFDIRPECLETSMEAVRVLGIRGISVTIPFKEKVMGFLDHLDGQARAIGAVNTVVNNNGHLTGYNTDGNGFLRSMEEETGITPQGKKVLILGAGGAARSIICALAGAGTVEISVANRTRERAFSLVQLAEGFNVKGQALNDSPEELKKIINKVDIIINTTSVGMTPNPHHSPLGDLSVILQSGQLVCDIIYNPQETKLLRDAKSQGCKTLKGLGMLVYQGAEAFKLWTGVKAPVDVMRHALEERLKY